MQPTRGIRAFFGMLACLAVLVASTVSAKQDSPSDLVDSFHQTLLMTMKQADSLGVQGRFDKLLPAIDRAFHLPLMTYFVSSRYWDSASKAERWALVRAAKRLSAGELAVLFDGYDGETFEVTGTRALKDESVIVETEMKRRTEPPVAVNYRLRAFKSGWRIVDVMLDGNISQLVKRKGEYASILRDGGVTGLTEVLNAKTEEMLRGE